MAHDDADAAAAGRRARGTIEPRRQRAQWSTALAVLYRQSKAPADNGQSNSESNSGSYSPSNRGSSGQSCGENYEEGDSDRNGQRDR